MKKTLLLLCLLLALIPLFGQEKYKLANETNESRCKDLVMHLNIILIFGQDYAKLHGMTASEFGQFVGNLLVKQGWAEGGDFNSLTKACLYNLSSFLSDSEIEIIENKPDMVIIKSAMFGGFLNKEEPCYLISNKNYIDYFSAAMNTLAGHNGCNYSAVTEGDVVFTTISNGNM